MKKLFLAALVIITAAQAYAQPAGATASSPRFENAPVFKPYIGFSLGTPGYLNFDLLLLRQNAPLYVPGILFTFSIPTFFMNGSDASTGEGEEGDQFVAMELGAPFGLVKGDLVMVALTPIVGFAAFDVTSLDGNNDPYKNSGWWVYAGGAAEIKFWYLFAEIGVVYGPSKNTVQIELADKVSMIGKLGLLWTF